MSDLTRISLADAVRDLRDEIYQAINAGQGEKVKFRLGQVELELSVSAEKEIGGSGKVGWWVLSGTVDKKAKDVTLNKLKITLMPHTENDQPVDIHQPSKGLD